MVPHFTKVYLSSEEQLDMWRNHVKDAPSTGWTRRTLQPSTRGSVCRPPASSGARGNVSWPSHADVGPRRTRYITLGMGRWWQAIAPGHRPAKHALACGPLAAQEPLGGDGVALLMVATPRQAPESSAIAARQGLRTVANAAPSLCASRRFRRGLDSATPHAKMHSGCKEQPPTVCKRMLACLHPAVG